MYGIELKPESIVWVDPSPYSSVRLANAILVDYPKKKNQRIIVEACPHPDDVGSGGDESLRVAIAVLSTNQDSVPVNMTLTLNTRMGLRISAASGASCAGAVVHVTGSCYAPPLNDESMFDHEPMLGSLLDRIVMEDGDVDVDSDSESEFNLNSANDDKAKVTNSEEDPDTGDTVAARNRKRIKSKSAANTCQMLARNKTSPPNQSPPHPNPLSALPPPPLTKDLPRSRDQNQQLPITEHDSGMRYQDLLVGSGKPARRGHNVALSYVLRLENGKVIDKADRRRPFKFRLGVGECIKGFDVGVLGMREGGERHLIVPPELGYGDQKMQGISPGSTLFFDVTLVRAF